MDIRQLPKLPLTHHPLTQKEAEKLHAQICVLLRTLNAPGDWGYGTQLGQITQDLYVVRAEIQRVMERMGECAAKAGGIHS